MQHLRRAADLDKLARTHPAAVGDSTVNARISN